MRRVMVTGIGLLTCLGEGAAPTWQGLLDGRTGIGPIGGYDTSPLRTQLGAQLVDFDARRYADRRVLRNTTRHEELALAGATLAMRDAGLDGTRDFGQRGAVFLGGNKEVSRLDEVLTGLLTVRGPDGKADIRQLGATAPSVLPPLFYVEGLQGAALFYLSQAFGFLGANSYYAGTAEAGTTAVGRALRAVRRGEADVALAGGFDDPTSWWSMSKMDALGVLSARNELGEEAFRPFDRQRSGSVLGDGAAFLVLEERESALRRGARCYAELRGAGAGNECHAVLTPEPDGRGLVRAIDAALRDAGMPAGDVGYVATHGCATVLGDITESRAIRRALGPAADGLLASSVKPQTGHLVAGAGVLNVAVAALAVDSGVVPPTLNLTDPDPDCDLDWVPHTPREAHPTAALALARGLAGQAVAVAVSRAA
jgi:3-oxoacyl-[acyl-carrier-protein] synthase II